MSERRRNIISVRGYNFTWDTGGTNDLSIAAFPDPSDYIKATIDEVRIYNRALSAQEVRKLYEWAPGPVAHWKFDEHEGTTAYDSAASTTYSGGNHGTLGEDGAGTDLPTWSHLGKYGGHLTLTGTISFLLIPVVRPIYQ